MSKTLKTRPLYIRMFDYRDKGMELIDIHNHENGRECDLPAKNAHDNAEHIASNGGSSAGLCFWDWAYNGHGVCGCAMCTNRFDNRWDRRRDRHTTKAALRGLVHAVDIEESNI